MKKFKILIPVGFTLVVTNLINTSSAWPSNELEQAAILVVLLMTIWGLGLWALKEEK